MVMVLRLTVVYLKHLDNKETMEPFMDVVYLVERMVGSKCEQCGVSLVELKVMAEPTTQFGIQI
jgi:hypothetical protein